MAAMFHADFDSRPRKPSGASYIQQTDDNTTDAILDAFIESMKTRAQRSTGLSVESIIRDAMFRI